MQVMLTMKSLVNEILVLYHGISDKYKPFDIKYELEDRRVRYYRYFKFIKFKRTL